MLADELLELGNLLPDRLDELGRRGVVFAKLRDHRVYKLQAVAGHGLGSQVLGPQAARQLLHAVVQGGFFRLGLHVELIRGVAGADIIGELLRVQLLADAKVTPLPFFQFFLQRGEKVDVAGDRGLGCGDSLMERRLLGRAELGAVHLGPQLVIEHPERALILLQRQLCMHERRVIEVRGSRLIKGRYLGEPRQHVAQPLLQRRIGSGELAREAVGDVVVRGLPLPALEYLQVPAIRLQLVAQQHQIDAVRRRQARLAEGLERGELFVDKLQRGGPRRGIGHQQLIGVFVIADREGVARMQAPVAIEQLLDVALKACVVLGGRRGRRSGGGGGDWGGKED